MADASPAINHSRITVEAGGQTLVTVPNARSYLFRTVVRSDGRPVSVDVCLTPSGEMVDSFAHVWGGDMGMLPGRGFSQIFIRNREEYYSVTVEIETSPEYISTSRVSGATQVVNGQLPNSTIERGLIVQGDDFNQEGIPLSNALFGSNGSTDYMSEDAWAYYGLPAPHYDLSQNGGRPASIVVEDGGYPFFKGGGWDDAYPIYLTSRVFKIAVDAAAGSMQGVKLLPPKKKKVFVTDWTIQTWFNPVFEIRSRTGTLLSRIQAGISTIARIPLTKMAFGIDGSRGEFLTILHANDYSNGMAYITLKLYYPEGIGTTKEDWMDV